MATDEDPEGHEIDALRTMIPSFDSLRVVEFGSGDGRLTRRYAAGTRSIVAVEPDAAALARLAAALPFVDARAVPVDRLELPAGCADVVLLAWSL